MGGGWGQIISLALNKAKLDWSQVFGEVLAWLCHHRPLRALYVFNQTPIASPISQPPQKSGKERTTSLYLLNLQNNKMSKIFEGGEGTPLHRIVMMMVEPKNIAGFSVTCTACIEKAHTSDEVSLSSSSVQAMPEKVGAFGGNWAKKLIAR